MLFCLVARTIDHINIWGFAMAEDKLPNEQTPKTETIKTTPKAAAKKSTSNKLVFIIIGAVIVIFIILPAILFWVAKATIFNEKNTTSGISSLVDKATNGNVKIDSSKGEVTVKGANGTEVSTKQQLPDNFPKDVPLYTPYEVSGSYRSSDAGKSNWSVVTTTGDSYDKAKAGVATLYESWQKSADYEVSGTMMSSYENSLYSVTVSIAQPSSGENNKTTITYLVAQK